MDKGNQTSLRQCRFLGEDYFQSLYETFTAAFSDYVIPFALTETQFRNHISLTAVDLERTVGCLEDNRLIGFSLNGFGTWEGRNTVYDAGTGVVPGHRRQGISEQMFDMMLPVFEKQEIDQFLLEVITANIGAIKLYEKLGFQTVRELALLQCDTPLTTGSATNLEIREIREPDWPLLTTFWDGKPSWQNSIDAVTRSARLKRFLGAFDGEKCLGYIISSSRFGRVAQLAVDKDHRRRGIGTALVLAMQAEMAQGYSMQIVNIDRSLSNAMKFFAELGFYERLSQHEMLMPLS